MTATRPDAFPVRLTTGDALKPADMERQWFTWSARHPVAALLIVGAVATQIATTVGYFLPAVGLPSLPWPLFNGVLSATGSKYGTAGSFFVGEFVHFLNGVVFVFLFAILMYKRLPFGRRRAAALWKAMTFAVILTLISAGILVPLVYEAHQGYGFLSFYGPLGWKLPLAILVWHLVYGVHIAALHDPARAARLAAPAGSDDAHAAAPAS